MHQKRVHQEGRPLQCKYCPNYFEQPGPLKRHITIDHPEIKKTLSEAEFRTVIAEALRIHQDYEGEETSEEVIIYREEDEDDDEDIGDDAVDEEMNDGTGIEEEVVLEEQ